MKIVKALEILQALRSLRSTEWYSAWGGACRLTWSCSWRVWRDIITWYFTRDKCYIDHYRSIRCIRENIYLYYIVYNVLYALCHRVSDSGCDSEQFSWWNAAGWLLKRNLEDSGRGQHLLHHSWPWSQSWTPHISDISDSTGLNTKSCKLQSSTWFEWIQHDPTIVI